MLIENFLQYLVTTKLIFIINIENIIDSIDEINANNIGFNPLESRDIFPLNRIKHIKNINQI